MRKMLLIAWREYSEAVKSKGFVVGIALAPILMFGGIAVTALMEGKVDTKDQRFAVVDRSAQLEPAIAEAVAKRNNTDIRDKEGKQVRPKFVLEFMPPATDLQFQRLDLSNQVREGKYHAFIELGPEILSADAQKDSGNAGYYSDRAAMDDARFWFNGTLNDIVRSKRMEGAGIDPEELGKVLKPINLEGLGLLAKDVKTGKTTGGTKKGEAEAFLAPFILVMLMYMMVMFGAMPQIHAVMEEKTQRIAEVLLGSVSPFQLMLGKLLGNLGIALTTGIVYIGGGAFAIYRMGVADSVPMHLIPWFFAYLLLAVAMYGAAAIAVGAAVNDAKEAQSLTLPVILPLIIPLFILMPVIKEPNGMLATAVSLFPPCTPLTMLLRQASPGGVPAWQPLVGMVGLVACTLLYVWAAGRVFRIGLLTQGKMPKLTELVKWAIRG